MGKSSKLRRTKPPKHLYAIGIGSNRPLSRRLTPRRIVEAAVLALDARPLRVRAVAPIMTSRPLGPSARDYANSAVLVRTRLTPPELLARLQVREARFVRLRQRRWGARTLDLDILLWDGGRWRSPRLRVPHPAFAERGFVLAPLRAIAAQWRDPVSGLSVSHLAARAARPQRG
ncbi:2-amino-4-hydroxy-6-hydroxymethyldihydropteridinediphosphokinase [soil metagenome]